MNRPMNLGYLVPEFPSQTHAFFWREINALRELGVQISLISTRRPATDACEHEFAEAARRITHYVFPPHWATAAGILALSPLRFFHSIFYLFGLSETSWRQRLRLAGLLPCAADLLAFARKQGLDHIHVHSCADAAHLIALCKLLGGPAYSLTLHGDLQVYGTDHRQKAARASFVSCVTRPLQEQIQRNAGVAAERAPIIWMGVDTERFRDAGLRKPEANKLHILTVARLNPAKGHRHALAAMRRALDCGVNLTYTIAGEGPARANIEYEIQRLGLKSHVNLVGAISETGVIALLQHSDAFVLPSDGLGEAAPVSVMEAMACGLPVVCSIIGGTPDMITDGIDGFLVRQGDEEAITERLKRLAADLHLRRRIGQAARQRAMSAFDTWQSARELLRHIVATRGDFTNPKSVAKL